MVFLLFIGTATRASLYRFSQAVWCAPDKDIVPISYGFRVSPAISMILEW